MADNVELDAGSGGAVMKTDDDGTAHWAYAKLAFGADNTQTRVTSTEGLPVVGIGKVSSVNSSTTPLGISGVFTGTAEEITNYASIAVSVFTDEDSAANGLSIEYSADGTNWDHKQLHTVTADTHHFVGAMGEAKWFRIVYTNGTTAQSLFRLQVIFRSFAIVGEVQDLAHDLTGGEDAQIVKAVLAGKKPDTTYTNIQATASGNLKVAVEETDAGLIDSGNSSTSTLTSSSVFTGTGIDASDYSLATVAVYASHDSAAGGISLECSSDNSNWDFKTTFTLDFSAKSSRTFQIPIVAQYFRVVYTNGGTNQTAFRLQTVLKLNSTLTTIHRVGDDFSADRSAELVKSVLCAQKAGAGDFTPIDSTTGGNLKVAVEEFDGALAAGTNLIGDVGISGARTSGGTSFFYDNDLDETKVEVKATAGQIYWIHCMNLKASALYLQIFNKAAVSVTVGTTTPDMQFVLPTQGDTNGAGFVLAIPNGIEMGTGITIACTTDSEGSTAPGANECHINMGYK